MTPLAERLDGPWAGDVTFARCRRSDAVEGADLAVAGVPFDLAVSNRAGARYGPRAIREQSLLVGEFPWGLWPWDFDPFATHTVVDLGDAPRSVLWTGSPDSMVSGVQDWIESVVPVASVLGLGGDHAISYPLIRAASTEHGPLSLVHLDSHTDTWDLGRGLNHGSMFRRAVEEGLVDPSRSIQIGIRTPNPDTLGFPIIDAEALDEQGPAAAAARTIELVGDNPAYLTFDIDFLDPSFAPGTGTPVVGGPSTLQARRLLRGLAGLRFVGADVVEVAPAYDPSAQITALAGATVALDLVHLMLSPGPR
ncbi:MAG: agmatinase [Solirubrobacterales bacterium]